MTTSTDVRKQLLMKAISGCSPDTLVDSILRDFRLVPRSSPNFHFEPPMVFLRDREVRLTKLESRILAFLIRYAETPVSRMSMLTVCWGQEYGNKCYHHLLDVRIHHLRRKLEGDQLEYQMIVTLHREGYMFKYPVWEGGK